MNQAGRLVLLTFVSLVLLGAAPAAGAAVGMPARQEIDTPPPEDCQIGRRSVDALQRLEATPVAGRASPTPFVADFKLPPGEPADAAAVAAITATQREAAACANAGDRIRVLSLYSEDFVRRILADAAAQGVSAEELHDFFTPSRRVSAEDVVGITAVRDARVLPDGRVGAFFDIAVGRDPEFGETDFVYFVNVRGKWLIDGFLVVDVFFPDDAASGTPAP